MQQLAREAQEALQGTRRKVLAAMNDACRDGRAASVARHLMAVNLSLQAAEYAAAEAVNEAMAYDVTRNQDDHIVHDVAYDR